MDVADLGTSIHGLTGHSAFLDHLMRLFAEYLIFAVPVVLAFLWFHREGLRAGMAFAVGAIVALGVGAALGSVWDEQRPFVVDHFTPLISHGPDGSFPSDHLLVLGSLVGACWVRARPLALVSLALAVLVALGRVFVGIHYPVDVLAGLIIGALCGFVAWLAFGHLTPLFEGIDRILAHRGLRPILFGRGTVPRDARARAG